MFERLATLLYRHRDAIVFWFVLTVGGGALVLLR